MASRTNSEAPPVPQARDLLCWVTAQEDNQGCRLSHPHSIPPSAAMLERKASLCRWHMSLRGGRGGGEREHELISTGGGGVGDKLPLCIWRFRF